jgi:transposase-like protein
MDFFSAPRFRDDTAAREYLEALRWPAGPVCPHCGVINHAYPIKPAGTYRCAEPACRKNFTVTMNSPMERSHIALHKWVQAFHLMCSSKKGVSAHQLHRTLDITYRSAWFMAHRIRECMRSGGLVPMGGTGKTVEADETYIGRLEGQPKRKAGAGHKNTVVTLVERGGRARSFHINSATVADIAPIVRENIARESALMTDEAAWYKEVGATFESHETVTHSAKEYVRRVFTPVPGGVLVRKIHTNTVEGYYSVFKRGMKGVYQHCKEKHLHRYLAEFDFRYSNRSALGCEDMERADRMALGIVGKRLTYRRVGQTA